MSFLELRGVRKSFGAAVAVEGCDLAIERGAFVSLLGPSGCGKTTTLRMLAGFESPTAGTIYLGDEEITRRPANQRRMGVVFQSYALFPNMTVAQNIAFGLRLQKQPQTTIDRRVGELLTLIDLAALGRRYPHQLSGGQQQRVALARALAIEPQVLLLDEPLSALDAKIRVSLRNEIRAIQRQLKITTIYVTHDQEEALALSDLIVVMNKGRIEQIGTPFQIYNQPRTPFVASFVGTVNILSGTVLDPVKGRVELHGQTVEHVTAVRDRSAGAPVKLAIRPEAITIAGAADSVNRLQATIDDVIFLGSIVRVRTSVGGDPITLDLLNHPDLRVPVRGQQVALAFAGQSCLLLEEPAGERQPLPA